MPFVTDPKTQSARKGNPPRPALRLVETTAPDPAPPAAPEPKPTRWLTCAETAKLMRKALKEAFPAVRFSVRSSVYAGGASIHVSYTDGPRLEDVEAAAGAFAGALYDGMQDLKTYVRHELNGEPVKFGADFVFVRQEISQPRRAATEAAVLQLDDRQLNNLEAAVRMGRHAPYHNEGPMHPAFPDWSRFLDAVARETLPPMPPLESATLASLKLEA